jgi:hypothetical protein
VHTLVYSSDPFTHRFLVASTATFEAEANSISLNTLGYKFVSSGFAYSSHPLIRCFPVSSIATPESDANSISSLHTEMRTNLY